MAGSTGDYDGIATTAVDVEMGQQADDTSQASANNEDGEEYDNKCCCGLIERESLGVCGESAEHIVSRAVVMWISVVVVIIIVIFVF
jgi:hypothetical protein